MDEPRRAVHDPDDERAACCRHRIQLTAGQNAGHSCHHGDYTPFGIRVHITRRAAPGVEKSPREDRHRGIGPAKSYRAMEPTATTTGNSLPLDSLTTLTTSSSTTNGHDSTVIAAPPAVPDCLAVAMLHKSQHHAARCHALHLLHILEPYEPNCWQSSEMIPRPGILDDMTPPPRPGIPLQVFWHFPARKEGARSDRHAEKLFQTPPCLRD